MMKNGNRELLVSTGTGDRWTGAFLLANCVLCDSKKTMEDLSRIRYLMCR